MGGVMMYTPYGVAFYGQTTREHVDQMWEEYYQSLRAEITWNFVKGLVRSTPGIRWKI